MMGIVTTDDVLGGAPRLEDRRVSVRQIAALMIDADEPPERVAEQLDVTVAEVHEALAYYHRHEDELRAQRERIRANERRLRDASAAPGTDDG